MYSGLHQESHGNHPFNNVNLARTPMMRESRPGSISLRQVLKAAQAQPMGVTSSVTPQPILSCQLAWIPVNSRPSSAMLFIAAAVVECCFGPSPDLGVLCVGPA